jgi:hypothetical protein
MTLIAGEHHAAIHTNVATRTGAGGTTLVLTNLLSMSTIVMMCLLQQWWADNSPDIPCHYGPRLSYFVQNWHPITLQLSLEKRVQFEDSSCWIYVNVFELKLRNVNNRDDVPTTAMVSRQQPWHTNPLWAKNARFCSEHINDGKNSSNNEDLNVSELELWNSKFCSKQISLASQHINDMIISKKEKLSLKKRVQSEDLRHLPFASK